MMQFETFWPRFTQRINTLKLLAPRYSLISDWDNNGPVTTTLSEPATEAEITAIEAEIGEPFPAQLRELFSKGAKSCTINWSWPGKFRYAEAGYIEGVDYDNAPDITSFRAAGYLHWDLEQMPALHESWREWMAYVGKDVTKGVPFDLSEAEWNDFIDIARKMPGLETVSARMGSFDDYLKSIVTQSEGDDAAFYAMHGHFFARSFPFSTAVNGDFIAIDRGPSGHMVMLNHEGCDEPGWFLGYDFFTWLDALSAMAFMHADLSDISNLSNEALGQAYIPEQPLPNWYNTNCAPSPVILDLEHPQAQEWMNFFWAEHKI